MANNWAGGVVKAKDGELWIRVAGTWRVPTLALPSDNPGADGRWDSSSWVGLGGFLPERVLLQAGVSQDMRASGLPVFYAWYEWLTPPEPNSRPDRLAVTIPSVSVSAGDTVTCIITYQPVSGGRGTGHISFTNESNGQSWSQTLQEPAAPAPRFLPNTAEWIMEVPNAGEPSTQLPAFSPIVFTKASCVGTLGSTATPANGFTADIYDGTARLTRSTISDATVTVDYIGPAFKLAAASGSALTSFALNGDSTRLYYLDHDGWVHELGWANGRWEHTPLQSAQQGVHAARGSALTSFALNGDSTRLYYLDDGGWVHELGWTGSLWEHTSLQSVQGQHNNAAHGSALTSFGLNDGGYSRVYYFDAGGWVHELAWTGGGWVHTPLQAYQSVVAAPRGTLTGFALNGNATRLYFLDIDGWPRELAWTGSTWQQTPLIQVQGAPPAALTSPLTCFGWSGGAYTRLYYFDLAGWVHELGWTGNGWEHTPLQQYQSVAAAPGSAIASFALNGNATRLYFCDIDGWPRELGWTGSTWEQTPLIHVGRAPPAAFGSALTCFGWSNGSYARLYYLDALGAANELGWTGSGWEFTPVAVRAASAA